MRERLYNLPLPTKDHIQLSGPSEILYLQFFQATFGNLKSLHPLANSGKLKSKGPNQSPNDLQPNCWEKQF